MEVSPARLNIVRGALGVNIILTLFFGLGASFFSKPMMESFMPNESFTTGVHVLLVELGSLNLAWAVAMSMAVRDPIGHRALMQAIIAYMVIFLIGQAYLFITVPLPTESWIGSILLLVLAGVIGSTYPWREATT